jgi:hypothetical protein
MLALVGITAAGMRFLRSTERNRDNDKRKNQREFKDKYLGR